MTKALELLAPARNAEIAIEAIRHGADAVYIGGPAFGARHDAGNAVADIGRLAAFAHRFHARVFVTLNTIFRDDELDEARKLAWQVYEADVVTPALEVAPVSPVLPCVVAASIESWKQPASRMQARRLGTRRSTGTAR